MEDERNPQLLALYDLAVDAINSYMELAGEEETTDVSRMVERLAAITQELPEGYFDAR